MTPQHREQLQEFLAKEIVKQKNIEDYSYNARRNYVRLHPEVKDGFCVNGMQDWAAVSAHVRIKAAELLLDGLELCEQKMGKTLKLVSSVLVSSNQWLTSLERAHEVDVCGIRKDLDDFFEGLNYVAVIEPGLYPRLHYQGAEKKGIVSWHAHAVSWDIDRDALERARDRHNSKTAGILFGVPPANLQKRSWNSAAECLLYMLKTQAKSYSMRRIAEGINPKTGEVVAEHDYQMPQALRPGEHVHMRNVMRSFTLDDLLIAGGEVNLLLGPLLDRLLKDRELYYARQANRTASWEDRVTSRDYWLRLLDGDPRLSI